MANADVPSGLTPVCYVGGAPYNGAVNKYYIPATDTDAAVYVGGLVKLTGGADADGIPVVTGNVSTGNAVVGVVTAVVPVTADSTIYRVNSTARYVLVADDPNILFEVQEDADGGALAATAAGGTATLTGFTSGSATTGRSAIEIDSSGLSETSDTDDDVRIIRAVQRPDNELGSANSKWLVRLNVHAYVNAGVGV
jgi:hypothetical protein